MKILAYLGWLILGVSALLLLAGQMGWLVGKTPSGLGVRNGRLKPPSLTPNSVSSQAQLYPENRQVSYAQIEPIAYTGDGQVAIQKLASLLRTSADTVVVEHTATYLYAQCSTRLLRFTDDLELMLDESEHVIHVRSASRLGRNDFGVNRARVEALRQRFNA